VDEGLVFASAIGLLQDRHPPRLQPFGRELVGGDAVGEVLAVRAVELMLFERAVGCPEDPTVVGDAPKELIDVRSPVADIGRRVQGPQGPDG
jgi:hypothetical protein